MSEFIRRGECLEAVAKVNSALVMLQERIRQLRKDIEKLEAENKELTNKVQNIVGWIELVGGVVDKHTDRIQTLEIKSEELKARMLGWQEGFGETVRDRFRRIDEWIRKVTVHEQGD